jgi:hypothetical protein
LQPDCLQHDLEDKVITRLGWVIRIPVQSLTTANITSINYSMNRYKVKMRYFKARRKLESLLQEKFPGMSLADFDIQVFHSPIGRAAVLGNQAPKHS